MTTGHGNKSFITHKCFFR